MADTTAEIPEALLNAHVQFWTCLHDDHRHVTWHGNTAACDTCGLTSLMTREYADAVRKHDRAVVLLVLQRLNGQGYGGFGSRVRPV